MAKAGKNLDDLQDINRALIIRHLAQHEGCSRAELAKATGLKQASITKIIRALMNSGVVYETGFTEGEKGRRSIGLSLNYAKYKILAVKLSWQRLKICVYDLLGQPHGDIISIPFEGLAGETADAILDMMVDGINRFSEEFPEIAAVGVAVPGPYQRKKGIISMPPTLRDNQHTFSYPFKEKLRGRVSLPVFIEHDSDAGALGYWWFYANCNTRLVLLHILASEGMGGGVVESGHIFGAGRGFAAELGHITIDYNGPVCNCGGRGCLNTYCCFRSLVQMARERLPQHPDSRLAKVKNITPQNFFDAMRAGDALVIDLVHQAGKNLGYALISLEAVFSPDIVVVSDILAMGGQVLLDGINEAFDAQFSSYYFSRPKIELIEPSVDLVLLGAATVGIDRILSQPTAFMIPDEDVG